MMDFITSLASRRWRQIVACLVFIPAIAGALVPSYLHLADWYKQWMAPGWEPLSYVAALVTEAPVIACGISLILLPDGWRKRWPVYALLVYSVAVSIYVNARWAWGHTTTPTEQYALWGKVFDVGLGSAALPIFALSCGLVLDWVLGKAPIGPAPVKAKAPAPRKAPAAAPQAGPQAAPETPAPVKASAKLADKWHAAVQRHGEGKSLSEIARLEKVSRQAVGQWRQAAMNTNTEVL